MKFINKGINIGNNYNFSPLSSYNSVQNKQDLLYLKKYFNRVRVALPSYLSTNGITNIKNGILDAKNAGFQYVYGGLTTSNPWGVSNKNEIILAFQNFCQWCIENGIQNVNILNEVELKNDSSITDEESRDFVIELAQTLHVDFPDLYLIYTMDGGQPDAWVSKGNGGSDGINGFGVNMYMVAGSSYIISKMQKLINKFGKENIMVSEYGVDWSWDNAIATYTPLQMAERINSFLPIYDSLDIGCDFFSWRIQDGKNSAIDTNNNLRQWWFSYTENKNIVFKVREGYIEQAKKNNRNYSFYKKNIFYKHQKVWDNDDLDYLFSEPWAEYYGEIIDNNLINYRV